MRPSSFVVLAVLGLSACRGYTEFYPFRPILHDQAADEAIPAGVRWSASLQGVVDLPSDGVPARRYELTIEVEQAGDAWEPVELASTAVRDDEGNVFRPGEVLVAEAGKSKTRRYLVVYPVRGDYRFQSIGRTSVVWRLRAPGHRPVSVESTFRN